MHGFCCFVLGEGVRGRTKLTKNMVVVENKYMSKRLRNRNLRKGGKYEN